MSYFRNGALFWGAQTIAATTTQRWLYPGFGTVLASTTIIGCYLSFNGTLCSLMARHNNPNGNNNLVTYALWYTSIGGTPTLGGEVNLAANQTEASSTMGIFISKGSLLELRVSKALSVGTSPGDIVVQAGIYS